MKVNQVFAYLDSVITPESGSRVQLGKKDNVEFVKLFIFNKEISSYAYIITISCDTTSKEVTSKITSGFSGLDYNIGLGLNQEAFEGIKQSLIALDAKYMKELESKISTFLIPEIVEETEEQKEEENV